MTLCRPRTATYRVHMFQQTSPSSSIFQSLNEVLNDTIYHDTIFLDSTSDQFIVVLLNVNVQRRRELQMFHRSVCCAFLDFTLAVASSIYNPNILVFQQTSIGESSLRLRHHYKIQGIRIKFRSLPKNQRLLVPSNNLKIRIPANHGVFTSS